MATEFPFGVSSDADRDKRNQTVRRVLGAVIAEALPNQQTMQNTLGLSENQDCDLAAA